MALLSFLETLPISRPEAAVDPRIPTRMWLAHSGSGFPPDTWKPPRRAAIRPSSISSSEDSQATLTANYNAHLTRALFSPKKNPSNPNNPAQPPSDPLAEMSNLLTSSRPLSRPSAGLGQLRQLLKKIDQLERHRGFRADWVTANLVVKCWLDCAGRRVGQSKKERGTGRRQQQQRQEGVEEGSLTRVELRGMFEFVRGHFERAVRERLAGKADAIAPEQKITYGLKRRESDVEPPIPSFKPTSEANSHIALPTTPISTPNPTATPSPSSMPNPIPLPNSDNIQPQRQHPIYPYPQPISYTRHIRPFAHDLLRAFRHIGDVEGFQRVVVWQKDMRMKMEGR